MTRESATRRTRRPLPATVPVSTYSRPTVRMAQLRPASTPAILHLQHAAGNQAVIRHLEPGQAGQLEGGIRKDATGSRPELKVHDLGTAYERTADEAADLMMRVPEPRLRLPRVGPADPEGGGGTVIPPTVTRVLESSGQPLDPSARAFFEPRFGQSLDHVRVHTDAEARRSADALNARAYTIGSRIALGSGAPSMDTIQGWHLLAHEVAHVVQQSAVAGCVPLQAQREEAQREPEWLVQLGAILPGHVGLVTRIYRLTLLFDILGAQQLERHARLIYADPAATQFTRRRGVPGVVALYDTRRGDRLDVNAAREALSNQADRYQRSSLERLRLAPRPEARPSYWFQDPESQIRGGGAGRSPLSSMQQRAQVHIQSELGQTGVRGVGNVFVRFAYPATEVSPPDRISARVEDAKRSILNAIGQVLAEVSGLPPAASRAERREQQRVRARVGEALRAFTRSSPLHVFIATEPTPQELLSGQVAAITERVFVNLQDTNDPSRLQAAIRVPLLMLRGGVLPGGSGAQRVPAASPTDLQRTMLHEALHAMLVGQSSDANAIWQLSQAQLHAQGSPSAVPKFLELVRKYLISQEEVFAYENEASLYPPVSPEKAAYDRFISIVERFLTRRRITHSTVDRSIPVRHRVAGRRVTWTISYQVPSGTVDLTVADISTIDLLLGLYPLR